MTHVSALLTNLGPGFYLTGGAVRDLLLKHCGSLLDHKQVPTEYFDEFFTDSHAADLDFTWCAENATIDACIERCSQCPTFERYLHVSERYGTVRCRIAGQAVDVTIGRYDSTYTDKRRPDYVKLGATIEEDLGRRDFTCNAVAIDHELRIIDPYDGRRDIEQRVIRCVKSTDRLAEDPLRLCRAYRIAHQCGMDIDNSILQYTDAAELVTQHTAAERIVAELQKIFATDQILAALHVAKYADFWGPILLAKKIKLCPKLALYA